MLAWVAGFGFGLPGAYGAAYLTRHAEVWTFLGFPTYGGGPFESWGFPTLPMQMAFVLVCVAELIAGNLLWLRRPAGRTCRWPCSRSRCSSGSASRCPSASSSEPRAPP